MEQNKPIQDVEVNLPIVIEEETYGPATLQSDN
jgi:hypothetical protein